MFHTWPFSASPGALRAAQRELILERTLAVMPQAPIRHERDDDG